MDKIIDKALMDKVLSIVADNWKSIVMDPLGIAAFALFIVFLSLSALKQDKGRVLALWVFLLMAVISLCGGLGLAYKKIEKQVDAKAIVKPKESAKSNVSAKSKESIKSERSVGKHTESKVTHQTINQKDINGPAVAGVGGDVTINVGEKEKGEKEKNAGEGEQVK
jgi:hypothetical protein